MLKDFRLLLATTCILCIYVPGEGHQRQYLGFSVPRHLVKILRMGLLKSRCNPSSLHTDCTNYFSELSSQRTFKKKKKKPTSYDI